MPTLKDQHIMCWAIYQDLTKVPCRSLGEVRSALLQGLTPEIIGDFDISLRSFSTIGVLAGSPCISVYDNAVPIIIVLGKSSPIIEARDSSCPGIRAYHHSSPLIRTHDDSNPRIYASPGTTPKLDMRGKFKPSIQHLIEKTSLDFLLEDSE